MMLSVCAHMAEAEHLTSTSRGCAECVASGDTWVHLRLCTVCGHVGCCDESKNRHATGHYDATEHALIRSFEPGEEWWWCYVDEVTFEVAGTPPARIDDEGAGPR